MYQIIYITDKEGVARSGPEYSSYRGCIGEAKMDDGCVLFHCRYDGRGDPCDRYIRTSMVQSWVKDSENGRIRVDTMNSVYYLELVRMSTRNL